MRRHIFWIISGVLLSAPFLYDQFWWLVFPGLYIFILASIQTHKKDVAFFGGWSVGTSKAAAALVSIWYVYPLTWLGVNDGLIQLAGIILFWVTFSAVIGIPFGFLALLNWRFKVTQIYWFILFPPAFLLSEITGSLLYSIFTLGPGSVPNIYFSFGYLGYAISDSVILLPLAKLAGVYSLSFFIALFSASTLLITKEKTRLYGVLGVIVLIISIIFLNISYIRQPTHKTTKVTVVETYFDANFFKTDDAFFIKHVAILDALSEALKEDSDVIVLPEDSRFVTSFPSPELAIDWLLQKGNNKNILVIDSSRLDMANGNAILRSFIFDTKNKKIYSSDKQYLVPLGEFVPYIHGTIISLLSPPNIKGHVFKNITYVPGPIKRLDTEDKNIPGVLFCMESVSTIGVKKVLENHDAPFVTHPISHAWFNDPEIMDMNLNRMLKVQAVWSGKSIITAGNMAESSLYLDSGEIKKAEILLKTKFWSLKNFVVPING